MHELNLVQYLAVAALPLLFAITLHEVAHGWIALRLGDPTAKMLGRLTLNPLRHIDPIGTVALPLLLVTVSSLLNQPPFIFGWAKPVPVTWENLRDPRRDVALVSVAGPMANLLMAVAWAMLAKLGFILADSGSMFAEPMILMGGFGILFNIVLMVLNLLPLPPLDGGRILTALLPGKLSWQVGRLEPYGILIILILMAMGWLWPILAPIINFLYLTLHKLFGL